MARGGSWSQLGWSVLLGVAVLALGVLLTSLIFQMFESHSAGTAAVSPGDLEEGTGIIQVEVRNGVGESGLAGEITNYLRRHGLDVVASRNWTSFDVETTHVIDRVGNPAAARRVARVLGLADQSFEENLDHRLLVDVTVVIGHDYPELIPFQTRPSPR